MSNIYTIDLFMNTSEGGIEWAVQKLKPEFMGRPLKIIVKQVSAEFKEAPDDNSILSYYRIVHNLNVIGSSNININSNVLTFFDMYSIRTAVSTNIGGDINKIGTSYPNNTIICPNGLPSSMTLQRFGTSNDTNVDARHDESTLTWAVKLEITFLE